MRIIRLMIPYLRQHLKAIALFILFTAIFAAVFSLYRLETEAVFYACLLCVCAGLVLQAIDFSLFYRKHSILFALRDKITLSIEELPLPKNAVERDYTALIETLYAAKREAVTTIDASRRDMEDTYAIWVHQIKSPIAAMRLILQSEDSPRSAGLSQELFRIEQYVEMLLTYIRLGSDTTDYVLRTYPLDDIVRGAVRKLAPVFVHKKLALDFQPIDYEALTDEKWLAFVIEQVLSNALKYTPSGKITIFMADNALIIEDTGIGIASEDLPRICEKGFTGYNGRSDKKATGMGLFLCKTICQKLNHSFTVRSQIGVGTKVLIGLDRAEQVVE